MSHNSVNGFLEALSAAALSSGWENYMEAVFVLLVEFQGYPDSDTGASGDPVILKEKRYIPFHLTKMGIEITERGTKYTCEAVPSNELGYGIAGKLVNDITANGNTIEELLTDLLTKLNNQLTKNKEKAGATDGNVNAKKHHEYYVRFDDWTPTGGFIKNSGNKIGKSLVLDPDKHAINFDFIDAQTVSSKKNQNYRGASTPPSEVQYDEMNNVISSSPVASDSNTKPYEANNAAVNSLQFSAESNLYELMSNVVANSEYVRDIIENLVEKKGESKYLDKKTGMINYFAVRLETEDNLALGRDEDNNMPLKKFIYVISPYQIHFTRIPEFSKFGINQADLITRSVRSYDYIYTGHNQEILNFKLQYNYLFYEGVPQSRGANDRAKQTDKDRPDGETKVTVTNNGSTTKLSDGTPVIPSAPDPRSNSDTKTLDGIPRQDDPYFALANNLHKAVIDSKASMVQADMEILGDPFFLVTGGIGNQLEKPDVTEKQSTVSGQVDHLSGECIIDIKFKNPDDIGTDGADKGFMVYNKIINQPFQGAYRIIKVLNTFRDGLFKQKLELIRIPGQDPENKNIGNVLANSIYSGTSDADGQVSKDTRNTSDVSLAPSGVSVPAVSDRGVPTPDSRFTGNAGGFGIKTPSQVFGALSNGAGRLTAAASIFGGAIPGGTDQSSPIRLNPASLINRSMESVNSTVASAQAAVAAVQNFNINSVLPSYINNPTIQLSGLLGGGILSKAEEQLKAAESTVAANIDLYQSAKEGVSFKYVTDVANVPPVQGTAKVVTAYPPLSIDDQEIVAKGGLEALAKSRGVSVTELPTNIVSEANSVINLGKSAAQEIKDIIGRADTIINQGKAVVASVNPLVNIVSKSG